MTTWIAGPVRRSSVREMQQGQRQSGFGAIRPAPDAPLNARAAAYAYGLGATQDCRFRLLVSHGGGLPGFGSTMQWLPEYGVGVIVLANVTYADAGSVGRGILEKLAATGALQPRTLPASAPVARGRDAIVSLVTQWSDERLEAIAADNLLLDRPLDARRAEVARLREALGSCSPEGDIDVENWLRGSFKLECERGWLTATFTLAPTQPPRIQHLSFSEGRPLSDRLATSVRALASATETAGASVKGRRGAIGRHGCTRSTGGRAPRRLRHVRGRRDAEWGRDHAGASAVRLRAKPGRCLRARRCRWTTRTGAIRTRGRRSVRAVTAARFATIHRRGAHS